jgi:hypothetical protein
MKLIDDKRREAGTGGQVDVMITTLQVVGRTRADETCVVLVRRQSGTSYGWRKRIRCG